jgi:hypothetical protein
MVTEPLNCEIKIPGIIAINKSEALEIQQLHASLVTVTEKCMSLMPCYVIPRFIYKFLHHLHDVSHLLHKLQPVNS